jgi:hypothetical protein
VLRDTTTLQIGTSITTRLNDGALRSTVTEVLLTETTPKEKT